MSEPASVSGAVASIANKVGYLGGGAALAGGVTTTEWLAFGGFIVAVLGLVIQVIATNRKEARESREEKRRQAEHDAEMALHRLRMRDLEKDLKDAS